MDERAGQGPPSKVVVDYILRCGLEQDSQETFEPLLDLNRAHLVMLAAQQIVPRSRATELMRIFEEVCNAGPTAINWDPALGEVYYNVETHILRKTGTNLGGQMHTEHSDFRRRAKFKRPVTLLRVTRSIDNKRQ